MSFMEAVKSVFSKYATFSGRARRSEYWYFCLFNGIVSAILIAIGYFIWGTTDENILTGIWSLATLLPSLAVTVRRLHDIGKSGFWFFISFIPVVGGIIMIIWCATDSQPGDNDFGPNPKEFF